MGKAPSSSKVTPVHPVCRWKSKNRCRPLPIECYHIYYYRDLSSKQIDNYPVIFSGASHFNRPYEFHHYSMWIALDWIQSCCYRELVPMGLQYLVLFHRRELNNNRIEELPEMVFKDLTSLEHL